MNCFLRLFTFAILVLEIQSIRSATTEVQVLDTTLIFINRLFELQNLPASKQIPLCLDDEKQSVQLSKIIYQFSRNGSVQSSSLLNKRLESSLRILKNKISPLTLSCIWGSNDLKILLHRYNITSQSYLSQFELYTKQNFLPIHYYFTNMSEIFSKSTLNQTQKYQKVAQIINDMALTVYLKNKVQVDDPWKLRVEQVDKLTEYFGISVSNGVIGAVSTAKVLKVGSTVLAGAYDKVGRGRVDNLIQTFAALNMDVNFNGGVNFYNYVQQLNMKQGSMSHSLSSQKISLQYTYYALQNLPHVFYTNITVTPHIDGQLRGFNYHRFPQGSINYQKYQEDIDTSIGIFRLMSSQAKTRTGKLTLVASSAYKFIGETPQILHQDWDENLHQHVFMKKLKKGQQYNFAVITCLMSSQNHQDPINQAIRLVIRASTLNDLTAGHKKKWQSLWQSDIIIQGNDVDQKYVRTMLYHCYSFANSYKSYGLSPMGLSGLGYNGHVFWDMDLWIYPAILAIKPSLAKSLIQYRFERLQAAKQNAFLNGYKGAMYPWQSSKSGFEQTPVWAMSGPLQHHISGCVSFGAWNYYLVTQDKQWLAEKGYKIIQQVAMFFESRVQLGSDNYYHINNVVGSDQWAQNINDDAFTNGIAKTSLSIANKAAKILGLPTNPKWDEISEKIIILKMQNGVTKQHQTYKGQTIKQADVNLLAYPLTIISTPADIARDLSYYQTRIPDQGTPAMTYSIFALLYSRLKNQTKSYKYFKQSFIPYLRQPYGVFAESKGGDNPYFLTGAGGVLQAVIYGYGGFTIGEKGISVANYSIPAEWKKVTIKTEARIVNNVEES